MSKTEQTDKSINLKMQLAKASTNI